MISQRRVSFHVCGEESSCRENKFVASHGNRIFLWYFSDEKSTLQLCTTQSFSNITPVKEKKFALPVYILVKFSKT
jgi:hypothetical protein